MDDILFTNFINDHDLLREDDHVIVGCSTGSDSTALLALLCNCGLDLMITAVYVDHGLRPREVEEEKKMVTKLADRFRAAYEIIEVDALGHKKTHGTSLEQSCRILRYRALAKCCIGKNGNVIAVGHTADDQAEEILLRLFRGTGLQGLSGMHVKNGQIIRPLLETSKDQLQEYLAARNIPYTVDSSNTNKAFLRNRMRLDILPEIKTHFNSSITETLLQTADIIRKDDQLLDSLATQAYRECCKSDHDLNGNCTEMILLLDEFKTNHIALKRRIVEKILWKFGSQPTFDHISTILSFAHSGREGAELHLPLGLRVVKEGESLVFSQPLGRQEIRGTMPFVVHSPLTIERFGQYRVVRLGRKLQLSVVANPPAKLQRGQLLIDGDRITFPLILRPYQPGERFSPPGLSGSKKISRFLADRKIPRRKRSQYPVLVSEDRIVAVAGLQIDSHFGVEPSTSKFVLLSWQAEKDD